MTMTTPKRSRETEEDPPQTVSVSAPELDSHQESEQPKPTKKYKRAGNTAAADTEDKQTEDKTETECKEVHEKAEQKEDPEEEDGGYQTQEEDPDATESERSEDEEEEEEQEEEICDECHERESHGDMFHYCPGPCGTEDQPEPCLRALERQDQWEEDRNTQFHPMCSPTFDLFKVTVLRCSWCADSDLAQPANPAD
jgi:hypothetical protein